MFGYGVMGAWIVVVMVGILSSITMFVIYVHCIQWPHIDEEMRLLCGALSARFTTLLFEFETATSGLCCCAGEVRYLRVSEHGDIVPTIELQHPITIEDDEEVPVILNEHVMVVLDPDSMAPAALADLANAASWPAALPTAEPYEHDAPPSLDAFTVNDPSRRSITLPEGVRPGMQVSVDVGEGEPMVLTLPAEVRVGERLEMHGYTISGRLHPDDTSVDDSPCTLIEPSIRQVEGDATAEAGVGAEPAG